MTGRRIATYYVAFSFAAVVGLVLPKYAQEWDGPFDAAGTPLGADFMAFYTAGHFLNTGRADELYDLRAQVSYQHELLGPRFSGGYLYLNPPSYAVLMMPLARLPHVEAVFVWWGAGLFLLLCSAWLVHRTYVSQQSPRLGAVVVASLLFFPVLMNVMMGQNSFFSLAAFTGGFVALRHRRDGLAGFLLGILWLKPQLLAPWLVMLLVSRRWRALASLGLSNGIFVLLPMIVAPGTWSSFLELSRVLPDLVRNALEGEHGWRFPAYQSMSLPAAAGLLIDDIAPRLGKLAGWILSVATLLCAAYVWWRTRWEPGSRRWDFAVAATVVVGLLASPHLLIYDLSLLLLPAWVVTFHFGFSDDLPLDRGPMLRWMIVTVVAVFLGTVFVSAPLFEHLPKLGLPRVVPQLGTVGILGWGLMLARHALGPVAASHREGSTPP